MDRTGRLTNPASKESPQSMGPRRHLARAILIAVTTATAMAMPAGASAAGRAGGSITMGLELDIPGFDPLKVGVFDTAAQTAAASLFDTLTYLDENGVAQPKLALSWTHTDDFKTWTFKLRPGVRFHDGTPFNAEAAKANIDRQKDPANNCRCAFYISAIHDVQAPDELTLIYHLNNPSPNLPALLTLQNTNNVIQSPTAWKKMGDDYSRHPVGTGPFILKSWTAGDRLVLERNPDYWNKDHPYLDRIVLRPLPDAQSRFASLEAGDVDIIWDDEADADNIRKARKDPKLTVHSYAGSGASAFAFNTAVAPFDDLRVRQAIVMAFDRQEDLHRRLRPAGKQSLRRWLLGQMQRRRRAALRSGKSPGPDQGIRQARRVQDDCQRDAAGPRGRAGPAAVLETDRRQYGDRAGRPNDHCAARLHAPVPVDTMAYRRSGGSGAANVRQFSHRQPDRARQLLQPRA